ncbi:MULTISPECIES: LysR family transcriptional regulator [Halocynthiibacter]|uniref:LysR family transcriptional regulator n=1 Tax=Halocynthiibacter halioticoli TaxID=2986804 RepID=A0AAE3IX82_9RHOB|nr:MULTISPECIES: LysR family transcriptional regulator [Halocynthiibacter]MCV6823758.1 LysR family transcriptional regulator [Halocynthiibacter halioticoli]MCW4056759.1 LysR family transcriptional regulator [Halocynthiibacter sp. SDUM655004]
MPRNLDLTSLRSFVAVADSGGVTRAAGFLNLTQSAVSMQLKRLEESLGAELLDRSARTIALTPTGERLLTYARRMLDLNDEIFARMTDQAYEGEIVLGVPHDIVYPAIPEVLKRFAAEYPRMRVQLLSSVTVKLKEKFARGEADMILTTEDGCDTGGETLVERRLVWVGAPNGVAWRQRPLRLAFEPNCMFRTAAQKGLDAADIPWEVAVDSDSTRTIEASVSADLAVHSVLDGMEAPHLEQVRHGGALPDLGSKKINLFVSELAKGKVVEDLAEILRQAYRHPMVHRSYATTTTLPVDLRVLSNESALAASESAS